jgi:hypothetical protein
MLKKAALNFIAVFVLGTGFLVIYLTSLRLARTRVSNEFITVQGLELLLFHGIFWFIVVLFAFVYVKTTSTKFQNLLQLSFISLGFGVLLSYVVLISGAAISERSLTVYLLASIENNKAATSVDQLDRVTQEWFTSKDQLDSRLEEQLRLGNLAHAQSGVERYCITPRGRLFHALLSSLNNYIHVDMTYLNGSKMKVEVEPFYCE